MASKFESDRKCAFCNVQMSTSASYCSDTCFELNCEYLLIEISPRWVNFTLKRTKCPERTKLIEEYAKRHAFNLKLLKRRLKEKFGLEACRGK